MIIALAMREIGYRWCNFLLSLLSVSVAVATVLAVLVNLRMHDYQTRLLLGLKSVELEERVTRINNDVRKAMAKLGFTIKILPKTQNLGDWYITDTTTAWMPDTFLATLEKSPLATIENAQPCLCQCITWPEKKWTVLLVGQGRHIVRQGEHTNDVKEATILAGHVALGYEIHHALGYTPGDTLVVQGHSFRVDTCRPQGGTKDDMTIWLNLQDAQEVLDKPGLISEIRALETQAAWSDITRVRAELTQRLPDVQVVEMSDLAAAKTMARTEALEQGNMAINREREHRKALKEHHIQLGRIMIPIVFVVCSVWLSVLAFRNVQDRLPEIGIFMSCGYTHGQMLQLFLLRSLVLAMTGGLFGCLGARSMGPLVWPLPGQALLVSLVLTALACTGPIFRVSRQSPADVLRSE